MAGEMFGAPAGIAAAEADQRENVLGGLKALHQMGEIAMQPDEAALKKAHARYYNAEALSKEVTAQQDLAMAAGAKGIFQSGGAGGGSSTGSMADPIFALARFAGAQGYTTKAVDLLTKGTTVLQHESTIAANEASVELRDIRTKKLQVEQDAAEAAAVTDQQSYDLMRMAHQARGENTSWLPASYEAAKPTLERVKTLGISAKDQLAAKENSILDAATIKRAEAAATASRAAAAASTARARVLKKQEDDIVKNGGDTTGGARELRAARIKAMKEAKDDKAAALALRAAAVAARQRKDAETLSSDMLADPTKRRVGVAYNTPKGPMVWGGPAQGWMPLKPPASRIPIGTVDEPDEPDDDLGDE